MDYTVVSHQNGVLGEKVIEELKTFSNVDDALQYIENVHSGVVRHPLCDELWPDWELFIRPERSVKAVERKEPIELMKRVEEELKVALQDRECTSLAIFVNCEGVRVEKATRTAKSLEESCISMRNIKGDWIRHEMEV